MASASNLSTSTPTATATTTTTMPVTTSRAFTALSAGTKSPARPQKPQPPPFPIYHLYPSCQNIPIRPPPPPPQQQSQTPNQIANPTPSQQQQAIIYPVASSGRGFMPRPVSTVNTSNLSHPRGAGIPYRPSYSNHNHNPLHLMRHHPTQLQHHHQPQHFIGGSALAPIKGIPVTGPPLKAASSSPLPVSDSNGYKSTRDKSRDDNFIVIRDRKVKISEGASLYALCRSWLRNGFPEENQPQYGDFIKVLPRPLPESDVDTHYPKKEGEKIEENEEGEESVSHLSTRDLLLRHIKRAKKVRARLREGRLKRIARYKTRLAMLLPPQGEQFRNETAPGN